MAVWRCCWLFLLAGLALGSVASAANDSGDQASLRFSAFSKELEAALNRQDVSLLAAHFDVEEFARRVVNDLRLPAPAAEQANTQLTQMRDQLTGSIAADLTGSSWTFLRLRTVSDAGREWRTALFRIDMGDDGVSYWEFYLDSKDGEVSVVDWLNHAAGYLASDLLEYAYSFNTRQGGGLASVMFGRPDEGGVNALRGFFTAFNSKDFQGALTSYSSLPLRYQADPFVLVARLTAARSVGQEAYDAGLADLARYFGDDPRFGLLLSDHFLVKGDYGAAHRAIDQLSRRIDGDVALTRAHGDIDYAAGKYSQAAEHYRRAITEDRNFEHTYWSLLELFVAEGRYEDAVLVLKILARHFSYTFDAAKLAQTEGYGEFGKSRQFRAWAASLQ